MLNFLFSFPSGSIQHSRWKSSFFNLLFQITFEVTLKKTWLLTCKQSTRAVEKKVKLFFWLASHHALRIRCILGRPQWLFQIVLSDAGKQARFTYKVESVKESILILLVHFHRKLCSNIWINSEVFMKAKYIA